MKILILILVLFLCIGECHAQDAVKKSPVPDTAIVKVKFPQATEKRFGELDKKILELQDELKALVKTKEDLFSTLCETNGVDSKAILKVEYKPGELTLKVPKNKSGN